MKSRETSIRLQRFEVSERRQKLADIEMMIADFKRMANDLEHQIKVEQEASGIKDVKHFAYSTFAKAAAQRRDNLLSSIQGLEKKLAEAQADVDAALEELRKIELADERETGRNEDSTPEPLTPAPQEALSPVLSGSLSAAQGPAPAKRPDTSGPGDPASKQEALRLETSRQEALRQSASRQGGNMRLSSGP
jgi:flagellar protein FliJ